MSASAPGVLATPDAGAQVRVRRGLLALLVLTFVMIVMIGAFYLAPRPRSFAVDAQTRGVTLRFSGGESMNAWRLPDVMVCVRHDRRSAAAVAVTSADAALCDPRLYDIHRPATGEMTWREGDSITLSRAGRGPLILLVGETGPDTPRIDGVPITRSSRLIVPEGTSMEGLVLNFAARVSIGDVPGPGAHQTLISGRFEVREPMPTQQRPVAVMSGTLFSGDRVRIVDDTTGADIASYGFVVVQNGEDAMQVVAYSPPSNSALHVDRFAAGAVSTAPTWIDRVVHDPYLVAATAIMGVIAAALSLYGTINQMLAPPRQDVAPPSVMPTESPAKPAANSTGDRSNISSPPP